MASHVRICPVCNGMNELPPENEMVLLRIHRPKGSVYNSFGNRGDGDDGWLWSLSVNSLINITHPEYNECEQDEEYSVTHWMQINEPEA